jgi:hypothetical protein
MDQPDNIFGQPSFETEATGDYPTIDEGYYVGIMGRSYPSETKANAYKMKVFEVLMLKKSKDGNPPVPILDYKMDGQKIVVALRKNKSGELITESVIYKINFVDIRDDQTQNAKSFLTHQRRQFARRFNAFEEESGLIDWGKIQKSVGQIVSFNLNKAKDPRYVNMDFDTFGALEGQKADLESVAEVYKTLDAINQGSGGGGTADDLPF